MFTSYIKHKEEWFSTYPNTEEWLKKLWCS